MLCSVAAASSTSQNCARPLMTTSVAKMCDDGKKQFDNAELKQRLSAMEYSVTQLKDTEP